MTPHISQLMEPKWIPQKQDVHVVGIAGNEIPVHKPSGTRLIPYTLWGEIAYQMGGEELYRQVEDDATAFAAPGKNYLESVFNGKKVLIMIDELALYSARLAAVKADGSEQLAAFLMNLHDYARTRSGMSILLTLASTTDAFAKQTIRLAKLLSSITGKKIDSHDALAIGQQAVESTASVVSRDATLVVPVQAVEISRVLAKRLFIKIDESVAKETADLYMQMYRKNSSLLPDEANRDDFYDRMVSHYPFHPTFIDQWTLTGKLLDKIQRDATGQEVLLMDQTVLGWLKKENLRRQQNNETIKKLKSDPNLANDPILLMWEEDSKPIPSIWPDNSDKIIVLIIPADPAHINDRIQFAKLSSVKRILGKHR